MWTTPHSHSLCLVAMRVFMAYTTFCWTTSTVILIIPLSHSCFDTNIFFRNLIFVILQVLAKFFNCCWRPRLIFTTAISKWLSTYSRGHLSSVVLFNSTYFLLIDVLHYFTGSFKSLVALTCTCTCIIVFHIVYFTILIPSNQVWYGCLKSALHNCEILSSAIYIFGRWNVGRWGEQTWGCSLLVGSTQKPDQHLPPRLAISATAWK